jgi:hypothetical protein
VPTPTRPRHEPRRSGAARRRATSQRRIVDLSRRRVTCRLARRACGAVHENCELCVGVDVRGARPRGAAQVPATLVVRVQAEEQPVAGARVTAGEQRAETAPSRRGEGRPSCYGLG